MWLINTITFQLEEVTHEGNDGTPYAILSHCWEEGQEVSFQEFNDPDPRQEIRQKRGFEKIWKTCERAKSENPPLHYCWVDTCCIDKKSSAELTEAINSMFKWYRDSTVCYAYMHDLNNRGDLDSELPKCRYFTRGWTLQELIAPENIVFFDTEWMSRGTKIDLLNLLEKVTRIPNYVLRVGDFVHRECIARRMSWAANRQTKRVEDQAYCLMGLFGIHMPMIYGEGEQAFVRLQEELIKNIHDRSVFAWKAISDEPYRGLLARNAAEYAHCGDYESLNTFKWTSNYQMLNGGIRLEDEISIITKKQGNFYRLTLDCFDTARGSRRLISIPLHKMGTRGFVRDSPRYLDTLDIEAKPADSSFNARYLKHTRFFALKSVTKYDIIGIKYQYWRSLQLFLPPSAEITAVIPEGYWDAANNLFMTGLQDLDLAGISFNIKAADGGSVHRCVMVFKKEDVKPRRQHSARPRTPVSDSRPRMPLVSLLPEDQLLNHSQTSLEEAVYHRNSPVLVRLAARCVFGSRSVCSFPGAEIEASVSETELQGQSEFQVHLELKKDQHRLPIPSFSALTRKRRRDD